MARARSSITPSRRVHARTYTLGIASSLRDDSASPPPPPPPPVLFVDYVGAASRVGRARKAEIYVNDRRARAIFLSSPFCSTGAPGRSMPSKRSDKTAADRAAIRYRVARYAAAACDSIRRFFFLFRGASISCSVAFSFLFFFFFVPRSRGNFARERAATLFGDKLLRRLFTIDFYRFFGIGYTRFGDSFLFLEVGVR